MPTATATVVTVDGRGLDALAEPDGVLDCGNSGTTIRVLTGLLAGRPFLSVLTGDESLRAAADGAVSSSRCARWVRTSTVAPTATRAPLVVRGGGLVGCAHDLASRARR